MNKLIINPIKNIHGNLFIPGSKSISNRVLLLSALSYKDNTELINLLDCDDVNYMINILKILGVKIKKISDISKSYNITGIDINTVNLSYLNNLYCGNSGVTFRLILSILSLYKEINVILTGDNRMKERPIKDLVNSLLQGNAKIKYLEKYGYPPLKIFGGYTGGNIYINSSISSQFLSSLLIMSPLSKKDSNIIIDGNLVSRSYIDMTLKLIKIFGINIKNINYKSFFIKGNQKYKSPKLFKVESDMTSASYFLAAGAIKNGPVRTIGINKNSIQGEIKFINILKDIGANIEFNDSFIKSSGNIKNFNSIDIDANDIPDSAMTLAIVLLNSNILNKSTLRNIYNWRLKETDRLYAMSNELKKIGAYVETGKDYISILPPKYFKTATIETYNDHRIAMCFSLVSLFNIPITILNPKCVNKTFPEYFNYLNKISKF